MVAIEKRLETHQQALAYWYKMIQHIHKTNSLEKIKILTEAHEFWYNNSLFMEKETRRRFSYAISTSFHSMQINYLLIEIL